MNISAVFDCMVFIQGAARPRGPARRCLDLVDSGKIKLFVSASILAEIHDVLNRPKVLRRLPELGSDAAREFIRAIHARSETIATVPAVFQYPRDPKDEPYINLALAVDAPFLVTRDNDLLDLMRADLPEGHSFTARFPKLRIVTPEAFLVNV